MTGTGVPIIFIHGIGSNHLTWFQQVPHFCNRYSCVTYSHRGYPPSSEIGVPDPKEFAGDLAALIEQLKLRDPYLVAQSMGGWSAIEYVLGKPQNKPRALVPVSTCGRFSPFVIKQSHSSPGAQGRGNSTDYRRNPLPAARHQEKERETHSHPQ